MTEEADPHPALFDALAALLAALSKGGDPVPSLVGYQLVLLEQAGLWPDLTRCVVCDRPAPPGRAAFFSAHQGGLVCRICQRNSRVPQGVGRGPGRSCAGASAMRTPPAPPSILLDYTIAHIIGRPTILQKTPLV